MSEYIGVVIGGVIGITGTLITEYMTGKREDKRRQKELEQKRIDDAHEYFRGNYNAVKPFLRTYGELSFQLTIMGFVEIGKELHPDMLSSSDFPVLELETLLNDLTSSTKFFIDEGYASLFPQKLFTEIFMLNGFLAGYTPSLEGKSLSEMSDKKKKVLKKFMSIQQILKI